ncbi:hypothetical protein [Labilibaculum euxinus]
MEKTRKIISENIEKHGHFEEYFKIIEIIHANEFANPDICIESCKALIEGISKTIIVNLDNTRTAENIDDDNLPKLFKESMNLLSDNCEDIEGDFVIRFSAIIQVLGEIRNKRGDISHGRMAPKAVFSSRKLASTVKNMTESILEYVLEHYFLLDFSNGKLVYEDMEEYNKWLDDNTDFPIKKAKYSQLLYENDLDEYENSYINDFLKTDETEEVVVEEKPEIKEEPQQEKEIETLVNTFDEDTFWIDVIKEQTNGFAEIENLKIEELKNLITNYLFSDKKPLRDKVSEAMNEKLSLKNRAKVIDALIEKIVVFANHLRKLKEE